ncbi:MAG: FHA domain-containing protein [Kofleriaceae bacterium]
MFKLVIQDDEGKTTVVPLIRDEITIGRKEGNTIRLTERNVSRRHARILRSNNEVQIEDLGSYNGIRVNNARIAERVSLRISDQVQIGDYKLYLKAEGVEQVDDARTMPIERIDNSATATEAMPAISPVSGTAATPTQPIPATPSPAARELGVKDTDPAARPVATQAQINALTATAGYGKMVVLSSNFAGKEFELTRPQMIVGRTDENDLVINHRSISRNHAKITRDPETQRYTISDLQSSNGVRVNGQDYGKVELRRGDVIDLGHVRLRFVEPGEDFVFSRDAQIADIETGGKKGMLVAIVLAIVVIGAVGAFFAFKGGGGGGTNGSNNNVGSGSGSDGTQIAMVGSGSNGSGIVPDLTPDAAVAVASTDDCATRAIQEKRWDNLNDCTDSDPAKVKAWKDQAHAEQKNKNTFEELGSQLKNGAWANAKKQLDAVPPNSVYRKDAEDLWNTAADKNKEKWKNTVASATGDDRCKTIDLAIKQADKEGSEFGDAIRNQKCATQQVAVRPPPPPPDDCTKDMKNDSAACKKQFCATHGDAAKCQPVVATAPCDPTAQVDAGTAAEGRGDHLGALQSYESALKCKPDSHTTQLAFMAACNGSNVPGARRHWKHLTQEAKNRLITMCLRAHIDQATLDQ